MSSQWVTGICLGCGIVLIVSGIAQTVYYEPPSKASKASQATDARSDMPAPADVELADKFARALKGRSGVSVLRSTHGATDTPH